MIRNLVKKPERYFYVDPNEINLDGSTPLLLAAKLDLIDIVKILCDCDADPKLSPFPELYSPFEYVVY